MTAVATRRQEQQLMDRRIRKVLRWMDAEVTPAMVANYKACAIQERGSVAAQLAADEAAMKAEAGE